MDLSKDSRKHFSFENSIERDLSSESLLFAGNKAFTLMEMLIAIMIVVVLLSLAIPAFSRAAQEALRAGCVSNLRQLGAGISLYGGEHEGKFPEKVGDYPLGTDKARRQAWDSQIAPYLFPDVGAPNTPTDLFMASEKSKAKSKVFHCPAALVYSGTPNQTRSYAMNESLSGDMALSIGTGESSDYRLSTLLSPKDTLLLVEIGMNPEDESKGGNMDTNLAAGSSDMEYIPWMDWRYLPFKYRHNGKINILFADGHIDSRAEYTGPSYWNGGPKGVRYSNKFTVSNYWTPVPEQ